MMAKPPAPGPMTAQLTAALALEIGATRSPTSVSSAKQVRKNLMCPHAKSWLEAIQKGL